MQQPNIRLMKTPQNSTYNAVPASRTHHDYNRESEISDRDEITHIFFQIFSQEAKTNTKTSGSNYLQDSFSYHFWKLAVILDRLFILETTTAVSKQIALSLRQMPEDLRARQTHGKHTRSLLLLLPVHYEVALSMDAVLHKHKINLQTAVCWLSAMLSFKSCIPSYFELTGNLETHGTCIVKTLYFGVELPPLTKQRKALVSSAATPSGQVMFCLPMKWDPLYWKSSAQMGSNWH